MTSEATDDSAGNATHRLPLTDLAWLWLAGFFAVLGGAATLTVLELDDEHIFRAVLLPLYPGLATAYRIDADGHLVRTLLVSSAVNAVVYACVVIALRLLWKAVRDPLRLQPTSRGADDQ